MWAATLAIIRTSLFRYLAMILALIVALSGIYIKGEKHIQALWDADKIKVEAEIKILKEKANTITTVTEIKYVDRVKTITVKGNTITEYVDRFITPGEIARCAIPNNFILLHDSAVKNIVPAELQMSNMLSEVKK